MERDELIGLVDKILKCEGTEREQDAYINQLRRSVPHPRVLDVLRSREEFTAESLVDRLLSYRATPLAAPDSLVVGDRDPKEDETSD